MQPLRELAEPLVDASGPWPWLGLQSGFDAIFPQGRAPLLEVAVASPSCSDEVIGEIVELAGRRPAPLTDIVIWHHGGAMSRVGETETAYGGRDAPFLVTAEANWTDPAQNDEAIAWAREVWDAMEPLLDRRRLPQLPRPRRGEGGRSRAPATARTTSGSPALKAKYDPDNLFRMNINIPPAG